MDPDQPTASTLVELMRPNKSDVLPYLHGTGAAPSRYARVLVSNRTTNDPFFQDLLVGPLPVDNKTTKWRPLTHSYTSKSRGQVRNLDADTGMVYSEWIYPIADSIENITLDLWNATARMRPGGGGAVIPLGIDPYLQDDGRVKRWDAFYGPSTGVFDSGTLLPLGLYVKSDITGRDPREWKLEGWFYNNVFYETTEAFHKAFWSPGFEKARGGVDGDWAGTDRQGDPLPLDESPPPAANASSPPRFAVDVGRRYISWMDFTFYLGFSRAAGLSLFDVRYRGQRILYELGLQEALAHYAGKSW